MRLKEIDFLRGLAILFVLLRHFSILPVFKFGWCGVDLFFVLSGFLVSGLLFTEYKKSGDVKIGLFLIRRGFKIYPSFYVLLLVTLLYQFGLKELVNGGKWSISPLSFVSEVLFLQNYWLKIWDPNWSLAVEEHFYFLLCFLMFLGIKYRKIENKRLILSVFGGILVFCLAARTYTTLRYQPFAFNVHLFPTHLRIDSLLFGVIISYYHHFHTQILASFYLKYKKYILLWLLFIVLLVVLVSEKTMFMTSIGFTFVYLGAAAALLYMVLEKNAAQNIQKYIGSTAFNTVSHIGFYSYSIYLWHIFIKNYVVENALYYTKTTIPKPVEFVIYFVLSLGFGIFMAKIIEMPFLKLREKYFKKR